MKYLAILKDSVREALDSKVLYVMMGLSLVIILAVAGMTFEPQSPAIGLLSILRRLPGAAVAPFQEPSLNYDLVDFKQLEGDKHRPWDGQYRFTLIVSEKNQQGWPFMVWLWTLEIPEEERDPQDVELRKRFIELRDRSQKVEKSDVAASLQREIDQVTDSQMERFIRNQLRIYGGFEAGQVHRLNEAHPRANEYRFEVDVHSTT